MRVGRVSDIIITDKKAKSEIQAEAVMLKQPIKYVNDEYAKGYWRLDERTDGPTNMAIQGSA